MTKRILGISLILIPLLISCMTTAVENETEPVVEETKDDSLHSLVQSRDSAGLEKLFKVDINVNERDSSGRTALHVAAAEGASNIVQLLLLQKADPNALDNEGKTPLHLAVENGHSESAEVLVAGGSDIYLKDQSSMSPVERGFTALSMLKAMVNSSNVNTGTVSSGTLLHMAAAAGNPDAAAYILEQGGNPNIRNSEGLLPLDMALSDRTSRNKARTASLLVRAGSLRPQDDSFRYFHTLYGQKDINYRFDFGQTALHIASELGHEGVVKLLLEEGAQVQNRDKPGNTAIHSAVRGGYKNIVSLLISAGADVNATDYNSNVPLHMAMTLDRDTEILRLLLGAGADVNAKNSFGNTALHLSVTLNRDRSAAELLLEYGAVLEGRNKNGNTALLEAVDRGNAQIALLLLNRGADIFARNNKGDTPISMSLRRGVTTLSWFMTPKNINAQDNEGNSALHMAVLMTASDDVIRFLLENDAEIDSRNFAGDTALHLAVEKENIGLTDQFLTLGGDIYVENNAGETPLSQSFEKGPEFVERFLIEAVVEKTDSLNYTPLFHAVLWEKPEIVRVIIDKGASINRKSLIGSTPLHEAVKTGNVEIAGILLRAGADVDATDNQGNTPLHEIVYWNSLNLAELLIAAGADINKKNLGGRSAFHEAV
ncbi:MAG: ankyrin repeat domain-containing protein, partial [Spirochaetales bacterium]|nr:ankyrin repeat domain-containing protein [Spirochaetales bacterium]